MTLIADSNAVRSCAPVRSTWNALDRHSSEGWNPVPLFVQESVERGEARLSIALMQFELAQEQELGSSLRWSDEREGFAA
jgi:hypothetical protein